MASSQKIWFLAPAFLALTGCGARPAPTPPHIVSAPATGQAALTSRPSAARQAIRAKAMLPLPASTPTRRITAQQATTKSTAIRVRPPHEAAVSSAYQNVSPALWASDFPHQRALFVQQLRRQQARPRQAGDLFYSVDASGNIYHLEPGGPRKISDAELKHPSTAHP